MAIPQGPCKRLAHSNTSDVLPLKEKLGDEEIDIVKHNSPSVSQSDLDDDHVLMLNGEPVIRSGKDVSRLVVDIRDDGEDALTFRSVILGTIFAGLGAALCQVGAYVGCHTSRTNEW